MSCHVKAFWLQSEFPVHVDDPLEEEGPGGVLDLGLHLLEVVYRHHVLHLFLAHNLIDVLCKFDYALGVIELLSVLLRHFLLFLLLVFSETLSELLLDSRRVVSLLYRLVVGG
jgi:hypothetical protein